jgi:hypothetical protein
MVNPGKALENVGRNDLVIAEVFQSFSTKIRMVFHGNALKHMFNYEHSPDLSPHDPTRMW